MSNKLKIGICEDEKLYSDRIVSLLEAFFAKEKEPFQTEIYRDGKELADRMHGGEEYDLILMDLQLQNSDGIRTAEEIRKSYPGIPLIIVTGMEDRVLEGYTVDALDYVLKKDMDSRLEAALCRFQSKRRSGSVHFQDTEGQLVLLNRKEILWAESEKRGTKIGTCEKDYHSVEPIGKISAQLPAGEYMEIYKAVFVRGEQIKSIGLDYVVMSNGITLPLSRRKKKEVLRCVLNSVKERLE